ncbi:MAG: hypothetical protein QXG39_02360 [Candidatus Aenigmatarchaeota archaeon]
MSQENLLKAKITFLKHSNTSRMYPDDYINILTQLSQTYYLIQKEGYRLPGFQTQDLTELRNTLITALNRIPYTINVKTEDTYKARVGTSKVLSAILGNNVILNDVLYLQVLDDRVIRELNTLNMYIDDAIALKGTDALAAIRNNKPIENAWIKIKTADIVLSSSEIGEKTRFP